MDTHQAIFISELLPQVMSAQLGSGAGVVVSPRLHGGKLSLSILVSSTAVIRHFTAPWLVALFIHTLTWTMKWVREVPIMILSANQPPWGRDRKLSIRNVWFPFHSIVSGWEVAASQG